MATFIVLIVSVFLPWYYVQYKYVSSNEYNPDKYTSGAYINAWYIFENVDCKSTATNACSGQPGSLIQSEGFRLWITFSSGAFGMRILFLVCWGLVIVEMLLCVYLVIRRNKARIVSYFGFLSMLVSTFFFLFLRFAFYPCTFNGLDVPTGPCESFVSSVEIDAQRSFDFGPYVGWYSTFLACFFSALGLLFSILSPSPEKSFISI